MSKEDRLNRVLAGLSHTGYTTEIEKCEARLFIEQLQQENQELKDTIRKVITMMYKWNKQEIAEWLEAQINSQCAWTPQDKEVK